VDIPVDLDFICQEEGFNVYVEDLNEFEQQHGRVISGILFLSSGDKDIYVNHNDIPERRRFTIAHELAHYYLHHGEDNPEKGVIVSFRGERSTQEYEADQFAAELLMPEINIREYLRDMSVPFISNLALFFDVSKAAMRFRMDKLNLRYIDL